VRREKILTGSMYGSEDPRIALPTLLDRVAAGDIEVASLLGPRFPLERVNEAFEASLAGSPAACSSSSSAQARAEGPDPSTRAGLALEAGRLARAAGRVARAVGVGSRAGELAASTIRYLVADRLLVEPALEDLPRPAA